MFRTRLFSLAFTAFFSAVVGCGYDTPSESKEVEVSGKVVGPDGQPMGPVRIAFFATGGNAVSRAFVLKPDGTFSGKMISGKYSYFISADGENDKKGEAIVNKLPESWRKADLKREISVSGGNIEIKF